MDHKQFQVWLAQVDHLSAAQRREAEAALSGGSQASASLAAIEAGVGEGRRCPHCGTPGAVSRGRARGLRRYQCKSCGKTFNAATGTPLAGLHSLSRARDRPSTPSMAWSRRQRIALRSDPETVSRWSTVMNTARSTSNRCRRPASSDRIVSRHPVSRHSRSKTRTGPIEATQASRPSVATTVCLTLLPPRRFWTIWRYSCGPDLLTRTNMAAPPSGTTHPEEGCHARNAKGNRNNDRLLFTLSWHDNPACRPGTGVPER